MECVNRPIKNCCAGGKCRDSMCPSTHDCCWQDPQNGTSATLGICVKKGSCDFKRGIPKKDCRDPKNKVKLREDSSESIYNDSKEGYHSCNLFTLKHIVIYIILFLFVILCFSGPANKKLKKNL